MVNNRDWSQLPSELLELIVPHIVSISDFIRFRSICTSWRKAAEPHKLRPQPPVLLLPYDASIAYRSIFSPATGRIHHLFLPQLKGNNILSTAHGWMLLFNVQTNALSLLNPVSLRYIHLPPLDADLFELPICSGYLFLDMFDKKFVVLIPGPCVDLDDYDLVRRMAFCKVGDESWSELVTDLGWADASIICHKGKFYGNNQDFMYAHEAALAFSHQSEPEYYKEEYALKLFYDLDDDAYSDQSNVGSLGDIHDILMSYGTVLFCGRIVKEYPDKENPDETISFYKLDYNGQKIMYSTVHLKDYAIFNSATQSIMCCVKDFPNCKENCVYSTRRRFCEYCEEGALRPVIGILDIKDLTTGTMHCGEDLGFSGHSMWITLSFHQVVES